MRAFLAAICLRGALPPVDLRGVCFVLDIHPKTPYTAPSLNTTTPHTTREIRAMVMVAFPCPPLPMLGTNGDGEEAEVNSHDFLSMLMNTAALRADAKADRAREEAQARLTAAYLAALRDANNPLHTMQAFTRDYMATYGPVADVRFRSGASQRIEEQQHAWLRAQYILRDREVEDVGDWVRQTVEVLGV